MSERKIPDVQRWSVSPWDSYSAEMKPDGNGAFERHEDAEALRTMLEEANATLNSAQEDLLATRAEADGLRLSRDAWRGEAPTWSSGHTYSCSLSQPTLSGMMMLDESYGKSCDCPAQYDEET